LMLGRPEAAPGGNNKTQRGAQRFLQSEDVVPCGDWVQHTQIERVCVCVCVCVEEPKWPASTHSSCHCLHSERPIYFCSSFQLIFCYPQFEVLNEKRNAKSRGSISFDWIDCRHLRENEYVLEILIFSVISPVITSFSLF
jgi:hypothetical protein